MDRILAGVALVGVAIIAGACGNSPTSPVSRTDTGGTPANQATPRPVDASGSVSNLSGACPTVTFVVRGTTVSTSASTTFSGAGCVGLVSGGNVDVVGTPNSDGSVTATRVRVVAPPTPPQPTVTTRGAVAGLSGTCPSLSFTIGQLSITTSSSTRFAGGMCSAIANGSVVSVQGTAQSGGTVLATTVDLLRSF